MALYAFDGTWNSEKGGDDNYANTNVVRFHGAYNARSGNGPRDRYVPGIGTRHGVIGHIIGGLFGAGELPRIDDAYKHLCENWVANDRVIDIVGFSRGAATTLDFCHKVQEGIKHPQSGVMLEPNPQIRFIGVWDVVPAFGLAFLGNQVFNFGHQLTVPTTGVKYCFHALALDERRPSFIPTRLKGAYECWFRGVHSDVGGGNNNRGLNDIALKWMMCKAKAAGLPIDQADIDALRPDATAKPKQDPPLLDIRNIAGVDRRHHTAIDLNGWRCAPATCAIESEVDEQRADELGAGGFETLPEDYRRRALALWETAVARARDEHDAKLDGVQEPLLALIQGRIALVTDDAQSLQNAREGAARLVDLIMRRARTMGWSKPDEFFLNMVIANTRHLFPFTD